MQKSSGLTSGLQPNLLKPAMVAKKSDLASVGDSTAQLRLSAVSFPVSYFVR
jgi:hypothetical protein